MSVESEVLAAMQAHVAARMNDDVDAVVSSYSDQWTDDKGFTAYPKRLAYCLRRWRCQARDHDRLRTVGILVDGDGATSAQCAQTPKKAEPHKSTNCVKKPTVSGALSTPKWSTGIRTNGRCKSGP